MKIVWSAVVVVVCFSFASMPDAASAQSVEDAVQKMLDPATFDPAVIDDDAEILVTSGSARRLYEAEEIESLATTLKANGSKSEISGFKVLDKTEAGQFVSIVYQVDWKSTLGNTTTLTHLTSHEIWERQPSGWRRLFAAMEH